MADRPSQEIYRFSFQQNKLERQRDHVGTEEPLEITLLHRDHKAFPLTITMRSPGHDPELAAGLLFSEGIIKNKNDIHHIAHDQDALNPNNSIMVALSEASHFDPSRLQRHLFTHSSCGVCGKTAIQALEMLHQPHLVPGQPTIAATTLCQLPERLRQQQQLFATTGGVHSAALFSADGKLLALREDVGRHNAMDKLVGSLLLNDQLGQAKNSLVLVSGRSSFELVQKALMADIPLLAAIGAPTSLAIQLAQRHGLTLAGFLKADGFNLYSAPERVT